MATTNSGRLNALAAMTASMSYLEIGVQQGETFFEVDVSKKVGVDPSFTFDTVERGTDDCTFHEVTSDRYFSAIAEDDTSFDLIFLDGLHTFDQTIRDFCASLSCSHAQTIWLIDDTSPTSRLAAHPNLKVTRFGPQETADSRWTVDGRCLQGRVRDS